MDEETERNKDKNIIAELQKDYFDPVSRFSTKNVAIMYFVNFATI